MRRAGGFQILNAVNGPPWGFNSVGRMSALQAECQRFESVNLHQMRCSSNGKTIDSKPINVGSIPTQRAIFPYLAETD